MASVHSVRHSQPVNPASGVRRKSTPEERAEMVRLYLAGASDEEASRAFGFGRHTCEYARRLAAVPARRWETCDPEDIARGVKKCKGCGEKKPLGQFNLSRKGPAGRVARCKE